MVTSTRCVVCGLEFEALRPNARYCTPAHRNKASRERTKARAEGRPDPFEPETSQRPAGVEGDAITEATRVELRALNLDRTALGLAAIAAAARVDRGTAEGGSAFAALVREHAAALTRALATGGKAGDTGDELADRRERRRQQVFGAGG